jgi:hypothetical protein
MPAFIDLSGKKFNKLTIVSLNKDRSSKKRKLWNCVCDCGNKKVCDGENVKSGKIKSCGCILGESLIKGWDRRRQFTKEEKPFRHIWKLMMRRCYNSADHVYRHYGARGIKVCEQWHDYWQFKEDMWPRPQGLTLERIDNDGDYCPENCKWATVLEQGNNRRTSRKITMNGETKTIPDWCRDYGVSKVSTVRQRLDRGWNLQDALTKPIREFRNTSKFRRKE